MTPKIRKCLQNFLQKTNTLLSTKKKKLLLKYSFKNPRLESPQKTFLNYPLKWVLKSKNLISKFSPQIAITKSFPNVLFEVIPKVSRIVLIINTIIFHQGFSPFFLEKNTKGLQKLFLKIQALNEIENWLNSPLRIFPRSLKPQLFTIKFPKCPREEIPKSSKINFKNRHLSCLETMSHIPPFKWYQ